MLNYDKVKNFKEIWSLSFYKLDQYVYYNVYLRIKYLGVMEGVKLFLLVNWWLIVLAILVF